MEDAAEHSPETPRGSHRLWAFLLILDSVFVIVFGGAVAAKAYQYWKAPAAVPLTVARRHPGKEPVKPPEPPKPAEPVAPAPASAETAKALEPEKPAAKSELKTAHHADSPRPPKPSLLTEAPKPHEAPKLAGPSGTKTTAAPASSAPESRPKAQPVEFKLKADAKSVQLVGAFIVRGGRKEMSRKSDGTWALTLYLHPGQYRYFFSVDKSKVLDPENPHSERGASLLTIP